MSLLEQLKAWSAEYECLRAGSQTLHEAGEATALGNEYSLQQLWQHQAFEKKALRLTDGTPLEVVEPGRWNHADGPDFQDAILIIGGELRRGNVELHVRPADWDVHGHAKDPAYGGLILHVTWYATPVAKTLSPQVPLLALEQNFPEYSDIPTFCAQHSQSAHSIERPCLARFSQSPLGLDRTLVSAGYYRLMAKTNRFVEGLQAENAMQVFYEGLMMTMGYSRNAEPFRRLAKEYPLTLLEPFPTKTRFAILARVAGLLNESQRDLWDLWWASGVKPPTEPFVWDLRGVRPQNHPFRRLAGALGIWHHLSNLLGLSLVDLPKAIVKAADLLKADIDSRIALVGATRAAVVTLNLFVPYRLALGELSERQLHALPGEDLSMPMRDTWMRLTGRKDGCPKDGLRQQGLLQIYSDFCHNHRIVCATCPIANG